MGQRNLELRSPIGRQQTDQRLKLWMEYLRISPSYGMAWEVLSGQLPESQAREEIADIAAVLAVARDFGDVWTPSPEQHWRERSFNLFGVQLAELDLKVVHVMQAGQPIDTYQLEQQVREYAAHTRREMGNPLTVLVSVPIDMNRQHLMQLFGGMLTYFKENRDDYDEEFIPAPKYTISNSRKPYRTLERLIKLVQHRAQNPQLTLRELGVEFAVNPSAISAYTDSDDARERSDLSNIISASVSRMLRQALLISENAARGGFPDQTVGSQFFQEFVYSKVWSSN